jgi:hypothetical protein
MKNIWVKKVYYNVNKSKYILVSKIVSKQDNRWYSIYKTKDDKIGIAKKTG